MIIRFNKKIRDDLVAIRNFINDYPRQLDEIEFFDFIVSYEYYATYYKNYHIFRDLIKYHNDHINDEDPVQKVIFPDVDKRLEDILGI